MVLKISRVILYDEPSVPEMDLGGASKFISDTFKVPVERRDSIISMCDEEALNNVAVSRIRELRTPFQKHRPAAEEIKFERAGEHAAGVLCTTYYDGFELRNALEGAIPKDEAALDIFHIIFTDKLVCTYDHVDCRYHGRAVIASNPTIISTTGIVEAPAKPREYYLELITDSRLKRDASRAGEKYRGTFLEYHDPRLGSIITGYIMQAVFYYETQEAFCDSADCKLYNAHWQRELLHSQLEAGRLCARHQGMLDAMTMT